MQDKIRKIKRMCALAALMLLCVLPGCGSREDDGLEEIRLSDGTAEEETASEGTGEDPAAEDGTEGTSDDGDEVSGKVSPDTEEDRETGTVFVYVCGAVHSPGVYELKSGARIYEAIEMAGGTTEDAAQELVNQAEIVCDGTRIYVPDQEEAKELGNGAQGLGTEVTGEAEKGKVNINTAGKDELMTLTGIGEAKAESILKYREENGKFESIEELMQIGGIKEGVFGKIKDDITV